MTKDIYVQAKADHIASLARATPLSAVEELVWNALDADAREVRVDLVQNALGGIDAVRVSDDGTGIDAERPTLPSARLAAAGSAPQPRRSSAVVGSTGGTDAGASRRLRLERM